MFEPIIKWSGSKRSQAENIVGFFPKKIETYYEPFCGGASVLRRLISSGNKVGRYVCSDLNGSLIALWNAIKDRPYDVAAHYDKLWNELYAIKDIEGKKNYFYKVRSRYNETKDPLDFMFIMRTVTNGLPRYNLNGEFNAAFHLTRDGITPQNFKTVLMEWSSVLNENDVEFRHCSYEKIKPSVGDFVYLDPPYASTRGMYYGAIDYDLLWEWMHGLKCGYALSFDGVRGGDNITYEVPRYLYDRHEYLQSGKSSLSRILAGGKDLVVHESIYLKGCGKRCLF